MLLFFMAFRRVRCRACVKRRTQNNQRAPESFRPGNLSEICARNWVRRGEGPGLVSSGVPPGVQMPPLSFSH